MKILRRRNRENTTHEEVWTLCQTWTGTFLQHRKRNRRKQANLVLEGHELVMMNKKSIRLHNDKAKIRTNKYDAKDAKV